MQESARTILRLRKRTNIFIHMVFAFFSVLCIIPLMAVISISLSREEDILQFGYKFIPPHITGMAYRAIFKSPDKIISAYTNSILVTVTGTICSMIVLILLAYPLSRKDYKYRNIFSFYIFFTMLFSGGIVPWYILIARYLNMRDTFFVLFVPYLVNVWYVLLLKTYFRDIPVSLLESANIDGASEMRILISVVLPLSKPALATVSLFIVLQFWNDWWLSLLFINKESLVTLQYLLYKMMRNMDYLRNNVSQMVQGMIDTSNLPTETMRMAMCIVAAGPMLIIFPFFQKYFVRGLTVGAVKG